MENKKQKFSLAKLINKNKKLSIAVIIIILLLLVVIIALSVGGNNTNVDKIPYSRLSASEIAIRSDTISMISKGGYDKEVPANTVVSMQKTHEEGYYDIYFDVQLTKDGLWVLFSEDELNGLTDMKGKISDYTYYELIEGSLDFDYVSEYVTKYKIPTLDEALEMCCSYDLKPYINILTYDIEKIEDILLMLEKSGLSEKSAIVSSDTKVLLQVQKLSDTQECWYSMEKITDENIGIIKANPSVGALFDISVRANKKDVINELCNTGAKVGCYTVNTLEEFEEAYSYGVTTFITQRILLK